MSWMAMDRAARIAAVREGAQKGFTARKIAALYKTGWHAVAAVAREIGAGLPDVPSTPQPDTGRQEPGMPSEHTLSEGGRHDLAAAESTKQRPASGEGPRLPDDPEGVSEIDDGLHADFGAPPAGGPLLIRLQDDDARLLSAMAALTGRDREELAASIVAAVLRDDAAAHQSRGQAA